VRIDLRSDTVTRPTPAMRDAMAHAEVGDDQFGEDPTANALQERALWVPSGTMANQVALRALTRPGDDVVVSRESHAVWHESGASAANAGVQFTEIGQAGVYSSDEFLAAVKPRGHLTYPPTSLIWIENTHNRGGGAIVPQDEAIRITGLPGPWGLRATLTAPGSGMPQSQVDMRYRCWQPPLISSVCASPRDWVPLEGPYWPGRRI
jgi:threonine aldolase